MRLRNEGYDNTNKIGIRFLNFFCLTFSENHGIIIKLSDESTKLEGLKSPQNREKRIVFEASSERKAKAKNFNQPDGSQRAEEGNKPKALANESEEKT